MNFVFAIFILLFTAVTVILDFSFTLFRQSSFYLSESLLFSTYWLLYLPLLPLFLKLSKPVKEPALQALAMLSAIVVHLFSYPVIVWVVSKLLFQHTFDYWQTFTFGLSAYFIKTALIYGFSFFALTLFNKNIGSPETVNPREEITDKKSFISSILIAENGGKKLLLEVNDILYVSANSPYINIHHTLKKYLHTETLKSLETQLDERQFVRIHKSHIVNIRKISSIQSRQNGDYDVTLTDRTVLRLSRIYAGNFKTKLEQHTLGLS